VACGEGPQLDGQALQVVERTKAVNTTYATYVWNRISLPGQPVIEEWAAEFHSGSRHRVETPRDRAIADCKAMTGTMISLITDKTTTGREVAAALCGIDTNNPFRSARLVGTVDGDLGTADRVELIDADNVRTYDITRDGIIVRTIYAGRAAPDVPLLEGWSVALEREVPSDEMFNEQSLSRSFVPAKFMAAPDALSD
jgi:hypothetical protein